MFSIEWLVLAFTVLVNVTVTRSLRIDVPCGATNRCLCEVDQFGYHWESCSRSRGPLLRQTSIKDVIRRAFSSARAAAVLKRQGLARDDGKTPDDGTKVSPKEITNHPAWEKLNAVDCGDSAEDRIIGGFNAALGKFPWIVRLGYVEDGEIDWMCGGALVTDRHVVTAAHCVQKSDYGYVLTTIRVGEHDTRTDPDCELKKCAPAVQDRAIKKIKSHPLFNKPAFHNDVAIIELDKPVKLNDYVAPICLPNTAEQLANLHIGEEMTVAGWGKMNMTTEERAKILQFVSIPVVQPSMCDSFGKGFKLSESEICAGAEQNKDACGGDSGGPLMKVFDTPEGPKYYLVGVVSFGPTICGIKKPGVYASVPHFLKWILDNLV